MYSKVRSVVLIVAVLGAGAFYWMSKTDGSGRDTQDIRSADLTDVTQQSSRPARVSSLSPSRALPSGEESDLARKTGDAQSASDSLASLSPLRRPIIQAIRASGQAPAEKRQAMLSALESSGASDEPWTDEAPSAFQSWRGALPKIIDSGIDMGKPTCFRAGCLVQVRFPNELAYREAAAAFRNIRESGSEHGGRVQTPPATLDGAIVANWIMLRPENDSNDEDGV